MYDKVRYFTVTGSRLPLTPATVEDRTAELAAVHADVFPPEPKQQIKYTPPLSLSLADAEIIAKAKAARNGAAFAELFEGGTGKHGSDSEADLALASHIAFYAGPDPSRIESVMKLSGLRPREVDHAQDVPVAAPSPRRWPARRSSDEPHRNGHSTAPARGGPPENGDGPPRAQCDGPNECAYDPTRLARLYSDLRCSHPDWTTLAFYRDEFHRWDGAAYPRCPPPSCRPSSPAW